MENTSTHIAACSHPSLASCKTYGNVALPRAIVEVYGTAPGMLATQ